MRKDLIISTSAVTLLVSTWGHVVRMAVGGRSLVLLGIVLGWTFNSFAQDPPSSGLKSGRIVGYLPDYRLESFDESTAILLTDLIVFSAEVDAYGRLDTRRLPPKQITRLKQIKQRSRISLILCVGGWDRSRGFAAVSASDSARARFVQEATRFCLEQRFDGIDLDWEHPANLAEQQGYARLISELKAAFREHALTVSVTMAAWQELPAEAFQVVDAIQVMAYDHDGQHSTLEGARRDLQKLVDRGAPPEKLLLGLPFYGRGIADRQQVLTYAEIVQKHQPKPEVDEVAGLYFNGPRTIEKKLELARELKLAGVMVWEVGQDAPGNASLLKWIHSKYGLRD
jgi:chitinase